MYDVTALGELLIDFTPHGKSESGNTLYETIPGRAPCNVLSQLCKLAKKTSFIGKVGNDSFGYTLGGLLERLGIGTEGLRYPNDALTTLAFVHLDDAGDRSFSFARNQSADVMLLSDEINQEQIRNSRIFHCGTLSMTGEPSRGATLKALQCAKDHNVLISGDPNLREPLWPDLDQGKKTMWQILEYADIIKISDYELSFLYGNIDVKSGTEKLYSDLKPKLIFATCGRDGAYLKAENGLWWHRCYLEVETIDTTGAGDTFLGAALSKLLDMGLGVDQGQALDILQFSSAVAALVTTRKGAIMSMPPFDEIERLIAENSKSGQ